MIPPEIGLLKGLNYAFLYSTTLSSIRAKLAVSFLKYFYLTLFWFCCISSCCLILCSKYCMFACWRGQINCSLYITLSALYSFPCPSCTLFSICLSSPTLISPLLSPLSSFLFPLFFHYLPFFTSSFLFIPFLFYLPLPLLHIHFLFCSSRSVFLSLLFLS